MRKSCCEWRTTSTRQAHRSRHADCSPLPPSAQRKSAPQTRPAPHPTPARRLPSKPQPGTRYRPRPGPPACQQAISGPWNAPKPAANHRRHPGPPRSPSRQPRFRPELAPQAPQAATRHRPQAARLCAASTPAQPSQVAASPARRLPRPAPQPSTPGEPRLPRTPGNVTRTEAHQRIGHRARSNSVPSHRRMQSPSWPCILRCEPAS